MNKFEIELGNWSALIKKYAAESSQISQKLRRVMRKNITNQDLDEIIQVFGKNIIFLNWICVNPASVCS